MTETVQSCVHDLKITTQQISFLKISNIYFLDNEKKLQLLYDVLSAGNNVFLLLLRHWINKMTVIISKLLEWLLVIIEGVMNKL